MPYSFDIDVVSLVYDGEDQRRRAVVTFRISRDSFTSDVSVRVNPDLFGEAEIFSAARSMLYFIVKDLARDLEDWKPPQSHADKLLQDAAASPPGTRV